MSPLPRPRSRTGFWIVLGLAYTAAAAGFVVVGAPSPYLFAGLVAAVGCALVLPDPPPFPHAIRHAGLAVVGVAAGASIDPPVLRTLLDRPLVVVGGVVATLALSLASGQLLRLSRGVNGSTAVLSSIAGGAAGVSAVAREVGADETVVMAVQYLRVLIVLGTMPLVATLLGATASDVPGPSAPGWDALPYTAVAVVTGLLLAHVLRFSAAGLLLPLLVATTLALTGILPPAGVPGPILMFGFSTIGLFVGLSFTATALRQVIRLLPLAVGQIVVSIVGCAAVGLVFARLAGLSSLDGYLATTPGGLPAVTALALGTGSSVGLILAVQMLRVFVSLLMAPAVGALVRRQDRGNHGPPQ